MSINLGYNPVEPTLAFRAAIESSLDPMSSLNECCENSRDYAKNITVTLNGDPIPGSNDMIDLKSVTIEDDGIGMDFAVMFERFRGAYFNSESHERIDQSGRNGIGVKTNLQYWNEIHVETTTKGIIPTKEQWQCSDKNRDTLDKLYRSYSKLHAGDYDTELRSMIIRVDSSELLDTQEAARDDSYTIVTLREPRDKRLRFNATSFIKRQSHCIEWLANSGHKLTVRYKNQHTGKMDTHIIQPFYVVNTKENFICHVKGNSKQDLYINYVDASGTKQTDKIPANIDPTVGSIDLDIKILDKEPDPNAHNDFVISICGANVYDHREQTSSMPQSVAYLMDKANFTSGYGFGYRMYGYIRTNDDHLKRALRHNKSVLDEEDKYTRSFISYIINDILRPLHVQYIRSQDTVTSREEEDILNEITKEFNSVYQRARERAVQKRSDPSKEVEHDAPRHKEFKCNSCGMTWKVPSNKDPSYCAEFNIDKTIKGCGSRDIERNSHAKNDPGQAPVGFRWVPFVGSFLPARYEPNDHCILLSQNHPSFVTNASGVKARTHKITAGIENGVFALAIYTSAQESRPVEEVYGELQLARFENRSTKDSIKTRCRKMWKEAGVSLEQI